MKFDADREFSSSSRYHEMDEEDLSFHDALGRCVYRSSRDGKIFYVGEGRIRGSLSPKVVVDRKGNIEVRCDHFYKNDRALIYLEEITKCMNIVLKFLSAAFEHGYLYMECPKDPSAGSG